MKNEQDINWDEKLSETCFPVKLTSVYYGNSSNLSKRYRAVVSADKQDLEEPFSIVTESYKLIRNEDVIELGSEAFERLYGSHLRDKMEVFNVVMSNSRASFFADFTTPELIRSIPVPNLSGSRYLSKYESQHRFFLRIINSYNKSHAVRIEAGICRWICRNGIIFGKQSIHLRDTHNKNKHQLMDHIAELTQPLETGSLVNNIGIVYGIKLENGMTVLEGVWQTLRIAIPPVDSTSRTAYLWINRCENLCKTSKYYEDKFGNNAFSILQAATQWAREQSQISPIQRHNYERRCGEMLESLGDIKRWPDRVKNANDQIDRIIHWGTIRQSQA